MILISEIKNMILRFIAGDYDPLAFSYDLPHKIVDNYDDLARADAALAKKLDDTFPEICAEYERGQDPLPFIEKIRRAYERVFAQT